MCVYCLASKGPRTRSSYFDRALTARLNQNMAFPSASLMFIEPSKIFLFTHSIIVQSPGLPLSRVLEFISIPKFYSTRRYLWFVYPKKRCIYCHHNESNNNIFVVLGNIHITNYKPWFMYSFEDTTNHELSMYIKILQ